MIKRLKLNMLSKKMNVTKIAKLKEGDEFVKAIIATDNEEVLLVSEKGMFIRFSLDNVRPTGKSAIGVIGMKFKTIDDNLLTMTTIKDEDDLIIVSELGIGKRTSAEEYKASKNKGGKGSSIYKANERTGKVAGLLTVNDENLLITTSNGLVIRLDSTSISLLSKSAMGVKLINLSEGDKVSNVAKIVPNQEEQVEEGELVE
jgi:DNA gyrase subunit A